MATKLVAEFAQTDTQIQIEFNRNAKIDRLLRTIIRSICPLQPSNKFILPGQTWNFAQRSDWRPMTYGSFDIRSGGFQNKVKVGL